MSGRPTAVSTALAVISDLGASCAQAMKTVNGSNRTSSVEPTRRSSRHCRRTHRFLRRFQRWADVVAFMRQGTSTDPRKDEVLRLIFEAPRPREGPALAGDPHGDFLAWTRVHPRPEAALGPGPGRALAERDLDLLAGPLPDRRGRAARTALSRRSFNDTVHHLHDEYRRAWSRTSREITADAEEIDALAGGVEGIDFAGIELREVQGIEITRLRAHMDAGRITEADFRLYPSFPNGVST